MRKIITNKCIKTIDIQDVYQSETPKFIGGILNNELYILMPLIQNTSPDFGYAFFNSDSVPTVCADYVSEVVEDFISLKGELFAFDSLNELMKWFYK